MATTIRSKNLDLIRWMNFGNARTAKKLRSIISNATYVSKMAAGEMVMHDHEARSIERIMNFAVGWMDRDNMTVLKYVRRGFRGIQDGDEPPVRGKSRFSNTSRRRKEE